MNTWEDQIEKKIIQYLKNQKGGAVKQKKIARDLGISTSQYVRFKQLLKKLSIATKIERYRNSFRIPDIAQFVNGVINFSGHGYAFVTTADGQEIFIGAGDTATALPHDTVLVEKFKTRTGPHLAGKVRQIIRRSPEPLLGIIKRTNGIWQAVLQDNAPLVSCRLTEIPLGLKENQLVSLTAIEWENLREQPRGKVKEILGCLADPLDDFIILQKMYNLRKDFPPNVIREVQLIETSLPLKGRLDLRDQEIFTIDPASAKDFDDAVSLSRDEDGNWLLGVHIADVSHYVQPGSLTDKEARQRGTSIYCGEEVIPMLPPLLSENICSLQPGKDKLTFSVLMTLTPDGGLLKAIFQPSVINSKRRFTYEEVQTIIDKKSGPFCDTILAMQALSANLFAKRYAEGSVDFDLPEPIFYLNEFGIPTEIKPSQRLQSHRIIEEFMLLANRCVAEYIAQHRRKENLPFLYRVHERPTDEDIENFYFTLQRLGLKFERIRQFQPKHLQQILESIQELASKNFIEQLALRSMAKAIYSHRPLSHFGLAFRYYTHFTSPIRRYPDLVIHRLLKNYLQMARELDVSYYRRIMPRIARQASENEMRAMEVEREYIKIKQIRFLENKIGRWYEGIITGVAEYGFFVEIKEYLVEGLVHVRTLLDDFYVYDAQNYILKGKRFGRTFRLGDKVKVKLSAVSVRERRIDFEWGE